MLSLQRVLWPLTIAAILGVPVAVTLAGRGPSIVDADIASVNDTWALVPVDLGVTARPDGTTQARIELTQDQPERLASHAEVRLLLVTYDATPTLLRGEIAIQGTGCMYRAEPGAAVADNSYLAFTRGPGCWPLPDGRATGRMNLILTMSGGGHVGLYTYAVPAGAFDSQWITLSARDPAPGAPVPVVAGRYVDPGRGPAYRRIDLLAYMWRGSTASTWLWALAGLAMVLVLAGCIMVAPTTRRAADPQSWRTAVGFALGVAAIGLGFALLYAVLVPPLQAPDEPDHLLAYAAVAKRPALAEETASLARRVHFNRIRFHRAEQFRSSDVDQPQTMAWGSDVFAHRVAERSVTTWLWWTGLAQVLRPFGADASLLGIRVANAGVFAVLLGVSAVILWRATAGAIPAPHMACLALLLVPTLPFFVSHVSEFAMLTSAYVLVAAVAAGLFMDGSRAYILGPPLGLAIALVFTSGRSGLPFAGVFAAMLVGRAVLGSSASAEHTVGTDRRQSAYFWAGLGVWLAAYPLCSTSEFRQGLWPGYAGQMPGRFWMAAELLRNQPWLLMLVAPAGFVAERVMWWVRRFVRRIVSYAVAPVRLACYGGAVAVACSLAVSLLVRYPVLVESEKIRPVSVRAYAADVFRVAVSGLRLRDHDFFLSSSFWTGFGWLDALPGDGLTTLLVLVAAVSTILLLLHVGRTGHLRRAAWMVLLTGGAAASLLAYAASSFYMRRNLHGRYLVGLYLVTLGVSYSVAALLPRAQTTGRWLRLALNREWVTAGAAAAIHAYAVCCILRRYFG